MRKDIFLKNLWLWKCGMKELPIVDKKIDIDVLQKTEWSHKFEQLCRNRLIFGAIRYGKMHDTGKPQYNRVESIIKRMFRYESTGNMEYLVDVANLCMLEFEECYHPKKHFKAIDDDGEHVEIKGGKV